MSTTYTNADAGITNNASVSMSVKLPAGWAINPASVAGNGGVTFGGTTNFAFTAPNVSPITVTFTVTNTVGSGSQSIVTAWKHRRLGTGQPTLTTYATPNPLTLADETPKVTAVLWANSSAILTWSSTTSKTYSVQSTTSLYPFAGWSNVVGLQSIAGSNGAMSATDSNAVGPRQFYRVQRGL